jgi:signal transduction histidine kinase
LVDGGDVIDWTIQPDITVMGNRELLAQMAANLLDNARIHTPAGTAIAFRLALDGGDARLSVEDNGPGVTDEDRAKLLQRFFRAEASRTTPGNGLGLNLVAAVARAHNGRVTIDDADPGLRVIVTLPGLTGAA